MKEDLYNFTKLKIFTARLYFCEQRAAISSCLRSSAFTIENHTRKLYSRRATRFYYIILLTVVRLIYHDRLELIAQTRKEYLRFRRDVECLGHKIVKKYSSASS